MKFSEREVKLKNPLTGSTIFYLVFYISKLISRFPAL